MVAKTAEPTLKGVLANWIVVYPDDDKATKRLKEIDKELKKLEDVNDSGYFGFERPAKQLENAEKLLKQEKTHLLMAKEGFPELNHSFLAWRKKTDNFPAFSIVELESSSGEFRITVRPEANSSEYVRETDPELPEPLLEHFNDTCDHLNSVARKKRWTEISISCVMEGFIHDEKLRERIEKVRDSGSFNEIFVIAESKKWVVDETVHLKDDPLVVGWVEETGQMFLIADFDLTPLEEHIKINFAH